LLGFVYENRGEYQMIFIFKGSLAVHLCFEIITLTTAYNV